MDNVKFTMYNVQIPMIFNLKFPRFSICDSVTEKDCVIGRVFCQRDDSFLVVK